MDKELEEMYKKCLKGKAKKDKYIFRQWNPDFIRGGTIKERSK